MDDYMLMEYMRNHGMHNMSEEEFMSKFKEFMHNAKYSRGMNRYHSHNQDSYFTPELSHNYYNENKRPFEFSFNRYNRMPSYMNYHNEEYSLNFSESEARHIVDQMYHYNNDRRYQGEIFTMDKAKEVCEKYKHLSHGNLYYTDVYVAINGQYHDYCALFKTWFGDKIDNKIIESAMIFWFKDDDYSKGSKVMNYFG